MSEHVPTIPLARALDADAPWSSGAGQVRARSEPYDEGIDHLSAADTRDESQPGPDAASRVAPRTGMVLKGTYVLGRRLGAGGMGEVFEASHTRLRRRFAVKLLSHRHSDSLEAFTRFRREAEISSRLGHPNIVEVIDFDHTGDGQPFLVMELLDGEDLASRLERGALPVADALRIAEQLGLALAAAHGQGIVHRDLKPQNVFLCRRGDGDGVVKVLDFGISKIRGHASGFTQSQVVIGTPSYMSPEQAQGHSRLVDARTDQFSLGVIVYEMLDGHCPFAGESIPSVLYQVVHHRPPPLDQRVPGLPAHVARAVARAMAKDPAARFPDVASFVAALTGATTDGVVDEVVEIEPRRVVVRGASQAEAETDIGASDTLGLASTAAPTSDDSDLVPPIRRRSLYVSVAMLVAAAIAGGLVVQQELEPPQPVAEVRRPAEPPPGPAVVVNLASNPPADEVLLNGAPVHGGQLWLPADGLSHEIVFRKAGYPDVAREYRAIASGTLEVTFAVPSPVQLPAKSTSRRR